MKVTRDIAYAGHNRHARQTGDFFSTGNPKSPICLLIHGGGWNALTKESIEPVGRLMQARGMEVFSVNYRLIEHARWPACLEDCLRAGRFVLDGGLGPRPERLIVAGASAGGHLAMMAGRALGRSAVRAVLSLAGPSRVDGRHGTNHGHLFGEKFLQAFFGTEKVAPALVDEASPLATRETPPDLICLHSKNDNLVPLAHSEEAVAAWRGAGAETGLQIFDGPGDGHGFWDSDDLQTRQMSREFESALGSALESKIFFQTS